MTVYTIRMTSFSLLVKFERITKHILTTECFFSYFFLNDAATTEIYTLSLHDALPIYVLRLLHREPFRPQEPLLRPRGARRSEEHTSELQSQSNLVCRLLLEKKKRK